MVFTYGDWIIFAVLFLTAIIVSALIGMGFESWIGGIAAFVVGLLILGGIMGTVAWKHTHTASGIRAMKDYQSELDNGIEREITIETQDGRERFHYEGKIDVESDHTDNYIKFESEEGKRYIIYYGITDLVKIEEV